MVEFHAVLHGQRKSGVIQKSEQGVQAVEHRSMKERVNGLDWNDLDLLCHMAKSTSLRHAAKSTNLSVNTIRSRLERLETGVGATIFHRSHDGIQLSSQGIDILNFALEIQTLRGAIQQESEYIAGVESDEISICCSEGLSEFWLMSMLPKLQSELPKHIIAIRSEVDQEKIHDTKYDVRVGFMRPNDLNMMISKIASVHCILFASPDYIAANGMPRSFDDLSGHAYVAQVAPGIESKAVNLFVGESAAAEILSLRVNTSVSLYHAVANSTAIAALPTFASAMSRHVVPVDLPLQLKFDLWLSFNRSARKSLPVRTAIDWVRKCFDPELYPWFADRFVHPKDFDPNITRVGRKDEFDHMIGALHQTGAPKTETSI
jgi:DNA-binding transcriptional LysR family regulator